jgi:hypothetical protein
MRVLIDDPWAWPWTRRFEAGVASAHSDQARRNQIKVNTLNNLNSPYNANMSSLAQVRVRLRCVRILQKGKKGNCLGRMADTGLSTSNPRDAGNWLIHAPVRKHAGSICMQGWAACGTRLTQFSVAARLSHF